MAKIDLTSGEWEDYAPPQTQKTSMQKIDLSSGEWEDYTPPQPEPQEQSLGQKLDRRVSDIVEAGKEIITPAGIAKNIVYPRAPLRAVGAVAGGINDVLGAGLSAAYKGLVPESIQKGISEKLPSLLEPIAPAIKGATEAYGSFKQAYPEAAKDIESGANIASLLPIGKVASLGKQAAGRGIEAASLSMAKQKGADIIRQEASNVIKTEFPKIFKMPSSLKKDYRASKQFLDKADNSMYDIVKNEHPDFPIKGSGNEPLKNYAENLTMRKQQNWDEITGMIEKTGVGTKIDQTEFIEELQKKIKTAGVSSVSETEKKAALKMMGSIAENPNITLGDAQAQLQGLNKALGGSIPYDVSGTAKIDDMYRNFLKNTIDAKVQALPDNAGFKDLKKLWGSHREVEETIVKTLNDSLGKSQKLNFIDITSGSLALSSLLTANPKMLLSVGMGEALNIARRLSGDINRNLVKLTDRVRKSQTMESKVREALKPKADVLGIRDTSFVKGENVKFLEGPKNWLEDLRDPNAFDRTPRQIPYDWKAEANKPATAAFGGINFTMKGGVREGIPKVPPTLEGRTPKLLGTKAKVTQERMSEEYLQKQGFTPSRDIPIEQMPEGYMGESIVRETKNMKSLKEALYSKDWNKALTELERIRQSPLSRVQLKQYYESLTAAQEAEFRRGIGQALAIRDAKGNVPLKTNVRDIYGR